MQRRWDTAAGAGSHVHSFPDPCKVHDLGCAKAFSYSDGTPYVAHAVVKYQMNKEEAWNKELIFCAERRINGKKGEEEIRRITKENT